MRVFFQKVGLSREGAEPLFLFASKVEGASHVKHRFFSLRPVIHSWVFPLLDWSKSPVLRRGVPGFGIAVCTLVCGGPQEMAVTSTREDSND